jgi:uncharacterized protein YjbI with pentapeptide repeats
VKRVRASELGQLFSVDLRGAYLAAAELQGADLREANLQGADLSFAKLHGANLSGADLTGASLLYAELNGTNLQAAILDLSYLEGINVDVKSQFDPPTLLRIRDAFYSKEFASYSGVFKSLEGPQYAEKVVPFLVDLSCERSNVANSLILKSALFLAWEKEFPSIALSKARFASKLAEAMLESEVTRKCKGVKDLERSFHEGLERIARARSTKGE